MSDNTKKTPEKDNTGSKPKEVAPIIKKSIVPDFDHTPPPPAKKK